MWRLFGLLSTTQETYCPAIDELLAAVLRKHDLPFEVCTGTTEAKANGTDRPDFVFGDAALFVGVYRQVKKPAVSLDDIAVYTERDDQMGRYLGRTGVVLISNIRSYGPLACGSNLRARSATTGS